MTTTNFPIFFGNDAEATLNVNVTDEGIVLDVIIDGEVVDTWGRTAQEIADTLFV